MPRHRGIALITALLVVAIATLAATALLGSSSLSIHRTAALRDSEQGWWVARGVESWILGILEKDLQENRYDGLGEAWALPVDYLPVDQGFVRGQVIDLHRCFNLNNLVLGEKGKAPAAEQYRKQLERLLKDQVQAPPGLAGAIVDWADADQQPTFPEGAEDNVYLQLNPPYRTADRPFTVVSELLAVRGMTPELYAKLRPLVCAVPELTKINVNTADPAVLLALSDTAQAPDGKFDAFIARRKEQPAQSVADFSRDGGLPGIEPYITVSSQYFQIQGEVFVGSSRVALYSLIRRPETGAPLVLAHSADAE